MGLRHYKLQIASLLQGANVLTASGNLGTVFVAQLGLAKKQALFNKDGTTLANPIAMTNGSIEFYTADTVFSVDLYGQAATGHGFIHKSVVPSGNDEIYLDLNLRNTVLVIPFDGADQAATVEQDTGFNLPTHAVVNPLGVGVDVLTAQAGKTINFGTLSTEASGVAAGFMNAVSLAVATGVFPAATITAGVLASNTYGTQLSDYTVGTNSDDRGIFNVKQYVCDGTTISLSYTLSTGTTTAAGFIKVPYSIPLA